MGSGCSCVGKQRGSVGKYAVTGDSTPTTPEYGEAINGGTVGIGETDHARNGKTAHNGKSSPRQKTVQQSSPTQKMVQQTSRSQKTVEQSSPSQKTVEQSSPRQKTVEQSFPGQKTVEQSSPGQKTVHQSFPGQITVEQSSPGHKPVHQSSPTRKKSSPGRKTADKSPPAHNNEDFRDKIRDVGTELSEEKDRRDEINRKLREGDKNTVRGHAPRRDERTDALVERAKRLSNRLSDLGPPPVGGDLGDGGPLLHPHLIAGTLSAVLAGEQDMAELSALVSRLESAVARLEAYGAATPAAPPAPPPRFSNGCTAPEQSTVPFVVAYDTLLSGSFKTFLDKSNAIGGDVAAMAKLVEAAFRTQRAFLVMASKSAKPSQDQLPKVLEATGKQIQEVIEFREKKRTSPQFNHLSAVSESIPGLSWVAVEPAPSQYCREMMNAAVFYTNRVLKDFREKDKTHVEWVQAYTSVFSELSDYIKEHHTTGVSWNPRGGAAVAAPPPPPPGGVPPPPPMVKLEPKEIKADPTAQLFQDINKGLDITSKLKKVSDDQKTHKNPSLREGPKPFSKSTSPQPPSKAGGAAPAPKPPRMQLEGKKWFVEYQKDNKSITVSETSMEQSVYVFRCEGSVVQVKGKINSIILDSCKKTAVVFDSLVSSLEVVNCQSCQAQVLGTVPTIAIEKTDGCMVYLSPDSLGAEIVTAKSSEMNILLPTESGEFSEHPVPEQFKTLVQNGRLVTTCTEKAGN